MVFLKRLTIPALALFCVLMASCGDDAPTAVPLLPNTPVNAGGNSAALAAENTSVLVSDQPVGFTVASDAALVESKPPIPLATAEDGETRRPCVYEYYGAYKSYLDLLPGAQAVSSNCNQIEYYSVQTGNTLRVKLHGDCALEITIDGTMSVDATLTLCSD